jgi:hypothetical protein
MDGTTEGYVASLKDACGLEDQKMETHLRC